MAPADRGPSNTHAGGGETTVVDYAYSQPSPPASPNTKHRPKPSSPSKAGRTDWVIMTSSPGPGAYKPAMQLVTPASERAVFGTAYREQEEKRFVSNLHNLGMPNPDTPGPGAYRTADNRLHRSEKSAPFGTAQQRPDVPKESLGKPGAVYDLPSTLSHVAVSFGNAPNLTRPGSRGARGSSPNYKSQRSMPSERFPLDHLDVPGPDAYPLVVTDRLSQHNTVPRYTFGRASREAATKSCLTPAQMTADATVSSAGAGPGPGADYDVRTSPTATPGTNFSRGPAHFSPELGGNAKGPYLGRLAAESGKGIEGPGPGTYPSPSSLQTAGGSKFGPPNPTRTPKPTEVEVPGPGAHNPNFGAASVRPTPASFSMGANLRGDFTHTAPQSPGPAAYSLPQADRASTNATAPSFSMGVLASGGRLSHIPRNATPAPDSYGRPEDPRDRSPTKKGYSFGLRERTKSEGSVITNRYHGPLAAQEGMGTESPGPGCYDVPGAYDAPATTGRLTSPATGTRFGTSGRDAGSKMYISSMHAAAEGYGTASPGPGCYNVADTGGVGSASRFAAKVAPKFGTSPRFNDKVTTK